MAQRPAFVDNRVGGAAAVGAVRGLCAVLCACCVAVGGIIREAVAQRAAHVGNRVGLGAVDAFCSFRAVRCAGSVAVRSILAP